MFPSPQDLCNPGIESRSPTMQADSLPAELQGKPKNTRVSSLSFLQEIFPIHEFNQGFLHCRWILYQLSYQGSLLTFVTEFYCNCGDSKHIQLSRETCIIPARYYYISGIVTKSSKWYFIILTVPLLQDGGVHVKISEFCEHGLIAALLLL